MLRTITLYPYASQTGSLDIPEGLTAKEEQEYVVEHFNEIKLNEPELDYCGTDIDID